MYFNVLILISMYFNILILINVFCQMLIYSHKNSQWSMRMINANNADGSLKCSFFLKCILFCYYDGCYTINVNYT